MNGRSGRLRRFRCREVDPDDPRLAVSAFGLDFSNPLGLGAGFDKNGEVVDAILRLGFGFTEVGTITPLPQAGNPRPRLFRLDRDRQQSTVSASPAKDMRRVTRASPCAPQRPGNRRDQSRRQQRFAGSPRRLCARDRGLRRCRGLFHDQCFFAQYAWLTRFAAVPIALDDLLARVLAARDNACRTVRPQARAFKDRSRSYPRRTRRDHRLRTARGKSTDLSSRIPRSRGPRHCATLRRTNLAASRAGRFSRSQHKCSRPPICAWKISFR